MNFGRKAKLLIWEPNSENCLDFNFVASPYEKVIFVSDTMDYLRMDGKQYASKVRNKTLEDFDWLSQWLE